MASRISAIGVAGLALGIAGSASSQSPLSHREQADQIAKLVCGVIVESKMTVDPASLTIDDFRNMDGPIFAFRIADAQKTMVLGRAVWADGKYGRLNLSMPQPGYVTPTPSTTCAFPSLRITSEIQTPDAAQFQEVIAIALTRDAFGTRKDLALGTVRAMDVVDRGADGSIVVRGEFYTSNADWNKFDTKLVNGTVSCIKWGYAPTCLPAQNQTMELHPSWLVEKPNSTRRRAEAAKIAEVKAEADAKAAQLAKEAGWAKALKAAKANPKFKPESCIEETTSAQTVSNGYCRDSLTGAPLNCDDRNAVSTGTNTLRFRTIINSCEFPVEITWGDRSRSTVEPGARTSQVGLLTQRVDKVSVK